jgi:hypothetical protein
MTASIAACLARDITHRKIKATSMFVDLWLFVCAYDRKKCQLVHHRTRNCNGSGTIM